jgi:hypothetical protein
MTDKSFCLAEGVLIGKDFSLVLGFGFEGIVMPLTD